MTDPVTRGPMPLLRLLFWRLVWAFSSLPADPMKRDTELMNRAAYTLNRSWDPKTGRCSEWGVRIANRMLKKHTMPRHAINALVRERERDRHEQAARAEEEMREHKIPIARLDYAAIAASNEAFLRQTEQLASRRMGVPIVPPESLPKKPYVRPSLTDLAPTDAKAVAITRELEK